MQTFLSTYLGRVVVIIYLLVVLLVASGVALQSWPDNPLRQRLYVVEAERLAALQVTDESIDALNRASAVASRLPASDESKRPNRADLDFLVAQLNFATTLLRVDPSRESSPLRWNRKAVGEVLTVLSRARTQLEARSPSLLPSEIQPKPFVILRKTFLPSAPPIVSPPLTSSEQARIAILIADMNNPRAAAESKTEIGRKVRPLLDKAQDMDFMLLVLALGAWGASAQSLASIAQYLGVRRYNDHWFIFYLTRPFIGATLAFAFYIVLRGGLLTRDAGWTDINHVGYAAIAVLVGFFSTEALENLKRIASGFFSEKSTTDGLHTPKPSLRELRWESEPAADRLELIGDNFDAHAQVLVKGQALTQGVHFNTSQKITCDLVPGTFAVGDPVKVLNPGAGSTPSDPVNLPPLPTDPAISSAQLTPAAAPNTLTLTGRRFAAQVGILVNGTLLTPVPIPSVSATSIVVTPLVAPPALAAGTPIRVVNLTGTGGTSKAFP